MQSRAGCLWKGTNPTIDKYGEKKLQGVEDVVLLQVNILNLIVLEFSRKKLAMIKVNSKVQETWRNLLKSILTYGKNSYQMKNELLACLY